MLLSRTRLGIAAHAALALGLLSSVAPAVALAQRETTRDALSRLEEVLEMRVEDGGLSAKELVPAIVVSVRPAFEESKSWYPNAAVATLARVFGSSVLRACEACMLPRTYVEEDRIEQLATDLAVDEIVALDERVRGGAPPARTAIWLDETADGVSLRMVDLRNGTIVVADNFDPWLAGRARSHRSISFARELDRRLRGDSITHTFFDMTMYPGQHFSFDWTEQWGEANTNLSGLSISLFDPVMWIGGGYYRAVPSARNVLVGGKVLMSFPTALVRSITEDNTEILDPLLTAVFIARIPIAQSNYGLTLSASTNGRYGVGVSLLNSSFLPFLP